MRRVELGRSDVEVVVVITEKCSGGGGRERLL